MVNPSLRNCNKTETLFKWAPHHRAAASASAAVRDECPLKWELFTCSRWAVGSFVLYSLARPDNMEQVQPFTFWWVRPTTFAPSLAAGKLDALGNQHSSLLSEIVKGRMATVDGKRWWWAICDKEFCFLMFMSENECMVLSLRPNWEGNIMFERVWNFKSWKCDNICGKLLSISSQFVWHFKSMRKKETHVTGWLARAGCKPGKRIYMWYFIHWAAAFDSFVCRSEFSGKPRLRELNLNAWGRSRWKYKFKRKKKKKKRAVGYNQCFEINLRWKSKKRHKFSYS